MELPLETSDQEGDLVEDVYRYLITNGDYPDECTETRKRVIRRKAKKFDVREGQLYYKHKCKGKVGRSVVYR